MKTAAALLMLLSACTGPNPDRALGSPRSPAGPAAEVPSSTAGGWKADGADDGAGVHGAGGETGLPDDAAGAGGGPAGGQDLGGSEAGGAAAGAGGAGDEPEPGQGGAGELPPAGGAEAPACPGTRAAVFPLAPAASTASAGCPMACHRLAGCSSYETEGHDLCPCLADGAFERVRDACLVACASEQGESLLQLVTEAPTCRDLVTAIADAFDPYAAVCGATLER